jgi:hypothetical protein
MKYQTVNLVAGCACLMCAIVFTAKSMPIGSITAVVELGVVNLVFLLV